MSYQRERDAFIGRMSVEGWGMDLIRAVLRDAQTLQRLATAQCNGDWPADNGERRVEACEECESLWARSVLKRAVYQDAVGTGTYALAKVCPDCRTARRLRVRVQEQAPTWAVDLQGDPRGYVARLHRASETRDDVQSGRARAIGVPARG